MTEDSKKLILQQVEYLGEIRKNLGKEGYHVLISKEDLKQIEMIEQTLYGLSIMMMTEIASRAKVSPE